MQTKDKNDCERPSTCTGSSGGPAGPKINAQLHDSRRFGLRVKGDELMTEHSEGSGQARAGPKMNAQIHGGRRFGLRMKGDELMTEHSVYTDTPHTSFFLHALHSRWMMYNHTSWLKCLHA